MTTLLHLLMKCRHLWPVTSADVARIGDLAALYRYARQNLCPECAAFEQRRVAERKLGSEIRA